MKTMNKALGVAGAVAAYAGANALARNWYLHWGAMPEEQKAALPGDEFAPRISSTRAVTIHAPVEKVWPWLVQIGQDRGGFYSYDLLEQAIGAGIHNADRIVPEWQQLEVGDTVRLASKRVYGDKPLLRVLALERNHYLVLEHWGAFVLHRVDRETTRLIIRTHADPRTRAGKVAEMMLLDLMHFVMERKMMLGIKERAEQGGDH